MTLRQGDHQFRNIEETFSWCSCNRNPFGKTAWKVHSWKREMGISITMTPRHAFIHFFKYIFYRYCCMTLLSCACILLLIVQENSGWTTLLYADLIIQPDWFSATSKYHHQLNYFYRLAYVVPIKCAPMSRATKNLNFGWYVKSPNIWSYLMWKWWL